MVKVVGVRFRQAGKIYHFDSGELNLKRGDDVIVETSRGIEFGQVVTEGACIDEEKAAQPLKSVIRAATEEDKEKLKENRLKEKEAIVICRQKIRNHGLEMKLIDCEYTFDNSKMLFYFTAEGRVDFRELVKDLASVFHTRIELRQVGVRDEAAILGGIGSCGRPLCCNTYLSEFVPVSIKMAKEQNLSLNTSKISGVCGRLMCCLKNEEAVYEELNKNLPSNGDHVITPDELRGTVSSVNILRQLVKVVVELPNEEKEIREYPASELKFKSRRKNKTAENDKELKALAELEQKDKREKSTLDD
ncbi:MAG: stage 0 sporulation family protein [Eubacteriales bacterium]|nr:stage 0 sporulation family protein [Eubacteriales bacterium]